MQPFDMLQDESARECAAVAFSAFASSLSRLYPELAPAIARLKRFVLIENDWLEKDGGKLAGR
jgi:hypothetical protein